MHKDFKEKNVLYLTKWILKLHKKYNSSNKKCNYKFLCAIHGEKNKHFVDDMARGKKVTIQFLKTIKAN